MYMCSINAAASASKCIMQVNMCLSKCRLLDCEKITNECLQVENTCSTHIERTHANVFFFQLVRQRIQHHELFAFSTIIIHTHA